MQLALFASLIGMSVDRVLAEILPGETGAARLQQLGLFLLVLVLEQRGEKVTVARIRELTRQSQSAIYKQLDKLVNVEVVKRTETKIDRPPGYVNEFSINYGDKAQRLIAAMGGPAVKKKARRDKKRG
jgi:hypothetical protein